MLSLTGFSLSEFEAFLPTFKYHWDEYNAHFTLKGKPRLRISYERKSSLLPYVTDKLLFILSYMKNNPLQDYHATLFDMTQPQCNEWIHLLFDILLKTLKTLGELPDTNHLRIKYLLGKCEDVLLDGTERPIERPQDSDRQKSCYSGKKTHNVKNDLLYTANKRILWLSKTYDGCIHDKKIVDELPLNLPTGITIWQDAVPSATVMMPTKKPKGKQLSDFQKEENRKISSLRILVEHAIGGVKNVVLSKSVPDTASLALTI